MATADQLRRLLVAYREKDDRSFLQVAESIISDEVAANHHALARDLKKALGYGPKNRGLVILPKNKVEQKFLRLESSAVSFDKIVLTRGSREKIDRVMEEHRNVQLLARYGYTPKRKLLFWGPPGCGKTLTAHYIAHELGIQVGTIRLSSLISSFLGDTGSHIDAVFELANKTPMVLLLDEVDALGKNRDDPNDVGELKRVVNSLLQAMDSFTSKESLIIAASNHEYLLDPALWRRFDDVIEFPKPTLLEIQQDLRRLLNGITLEADLEVISERLDGYSFADIERILTEAVKTMILRRRKSLTLDDINSEIRLFKASPNERTN